MDSRYALLVPDYTQRAFEDWYAYGANDETVEEFAGRWGGLEYEHFLRALEQSQGDDRLLAMFALAANADQDATDLLLPFLQSTSRSERCVSAIVLGTKGDTRAYPFLEKLLLEGLSLQERKNAFAGGDQERLDELFLCDRFRPKAVELLETWHSLTLIQTIIRALQALWTWEKESSRLFGEGETYHALLYALGQREVFTIVDTLPFPPIYQRIALVYQALGALQIRRNPTFMRSVMDNEERISCFLEETFHIDTEGVQACIGTFYQENEIQHAYRSGLDDQAVEERLAKQAMGIEIDASFFANMGEGIQEEEEHIEQKEPARVCVYRRHTSAVWSLAWSPDGTQIVSGSADTTAQVWDSHTGKQSSLFRGHTACVAAVVWSPDGQWIASGGCDNKVFVWNARTGDAITVYTEHSGWICNGLAWSPDGIHIASASWDGTVHIWESMTGRTSLRYPGHQGVVTSLAWSPDGTQVVSGGGYPECAVHVWHARTGQLRFLYKAHMNDGSGTRPVPAEMHPTDEEWARGPSSLRSVAWSPDGRWIASVGLRNVFRVWNARIGEDLIAGVQNRTAGPLAWSADSKYLATGNRNGVDLWDIAQKRIVLNYAPVSQYPITTLGWSPDMKACVSGGEHPSIRVWEVDMH